LTSKLLIIGLITLLINKFFCNNTKEKHGCNNIKEKHIPRNNVKEEHKTQQQHKERAQVLLTMQMKSMGLNNSAKNEHGTQQQHK